MTQGLWQPFSTAPRDGAEIEVLPPVALRDRPPWQRVLLSLGTTLLMALILWRELEVAKIYLVLHCLCLGLCALDLLLVAPLSGPCSSSAVAPGGGGSDAGGATAGAGRAAAVRSALIAASKVNP